MALVSNRAYLKKALTTIFEIRVFGKFLGDVVLIVGDDLKHAVPFLGKSVLGITPLHFADFELDRHVSLITGGAGLSGIEIPKIFQYHKFYCFHEDLRKWDRVLYVDAGMRVLRSIRPMMELDTSGAITAHSDAFPEFVWTLRDQFNFEDFPGKRAELEHLVSLDSDYFQTGVMHFDTAVSDASTVGELLELLGRFPNARTNDQAIINIWALSRGLWKRLPTSPVGGKMLYDFWERPPSTQRDYRMLKYPRGGTPRGHVLAHKFFGFYWRTRVQAKLPF